MINVVVGDISSYIENPKEHIPVIAKIREICKARPENYQFMPKYRAGMWDGYISLMHGFAAFPTGLLPLIRTMLTEQHYAYQIVAHSCTWLDHTDITPTMLEGVTLRDYQVEAANVMLKATRGFLKMATNSGKTEVMAAVIKALDCNTLVLVHRKELMYQTAQRFIDRKVAKTVGIIGDGHYEAHKITVGMIQTLYAHKSETKDALSKNQLLICDETHHISSDTMMDIVNIIPGSYRFGMSGTPLKHDVLADMKLMAATGPMIYDLDNAYLIDHGYSAKPVVHIAAVEENARWWKADYQTAVDELIVHNEKRNNKIAEFAKECKGTVLILVERIEHGNILKEMIPQAVFVSGSDTTEYRQQVIETMRSSPGVFIASPIFDEGVDIPGVDAVVIAGGGASSLKVLQRIGRGLRQKEGRNRLDVLDFIDDTNVYLLEHSDARIETYDGEGFKTELYK